MPFFILAAPEIFRSITNNTKTGDETFQKHLDDDCFGIFYAGFVTCAIYSDHFVRSKKPLERINDCLPLQN